MGSVIGSFAYNLGYDTAISFCIDTGFTLFGIVKQNYELPRAVLEEIGMEVFDYEKFGYEEFGYEKFKYEKFKYDEFKCETIGIKVLRRGVIGVRQIGYV